MAGEAPGGGAVHVAGGEGVEAQLVRAGVDILDHGLQGLKVGDLLHGVAGLRQQVGVHDDAVALIAVADGSQLAVLGVEVVGVGVQLIGDGGAGKVIAVVAPGANGGLVAHDKEGGGVGLVHGGGEGLVVGAGSSGLHGHRHAGLLGVHLGDGLQDLIRLGLEVQPKDTAGGFCAGSGAGGGVVAAAASQQSQAQAGRQHKSKRFLHHVFLLINFGSCKRQGMVH